MKIAGLTFAVEGTGGNCTAAVARVEGGTIAVTDSNLGTDWAWAERWGEPILAVLYLDDNWDTGGDWWALGQGATPDEAVEDLIHKVSVVRLRLAV